MNAIKMIIMAVLAMVFVAPAIAADQVTPEMMRKYDPAGEICGTARSNKSFYESRNSPVPGYLKDQLKKCELVREAAMKKEKQKTVVKNVGWFKVVVPVK